MVLAAAKLNWRPKRLYFRATLSRLESSRILKAIYVRVAVNDTQVTGATKRSSGVGDDAIRKFIVNTFRTGRQHDASAGTPPQLVCGAAAVRVRWCVVDEINSASEQRGGFLTRRYNPSRLLYIVVWRQDVPYHAEYVDLIGPLKESI